MPVVLPRLSVALQHVPDFLYQAQELARKYGYVKLVLLHSILDLDLAKAQPKGDMSRTLHVATSPALLGSDLPNSVEIPWPPYPANCTIAPEAQKPSWHRGIAFRKVLARPESFCA